MSNRYKHRNYDNHHNNFFIPDHDHSDEIRQSNGIYDSVKGLDVIYVPDDSCVMRRVDDVELLMSTDPLVANLVPPDVRSGLRMKLQNQPRSNISMSEDAAVLAPQTMGLEMDERANVTKSLYDSLYHDVRKSVLSKLWT